MLRRFFELFDAIMKEETVFLAKIIREGVKSGELKSVNPNRLAAALIGMNDALKHHAEHKAMLQKQDQIDYSQIAEEMKLLVSLIFKGLTKTTE